jgi:magnesium transporter
MGSLKERFFGKKTGKIGIPPGSFVYTGEKKAEEVCITVFDYDENTVVEEEYSSAEKCGIYRDTKTITWINIAGLHDLEIIKTIGLQYNIHPLILEDILDVGHRPKMEDLDERIYIMMKMLSYNENSNRIDSEQVSIILGTNCVISFQEKPGDVFEGIRNRIRTGKGRIRKMGADYLAYTLIDAMIDNYFIIMENIGDKVEFLEEEILHNPASESSSASIHVLKRELIFLRRSVWPLRELIVGLERNESNLITEPIFPYLRDVYEHTIQIIDSVESFRDMIAGMLDVYLSSLSNRMNEVMKVLTVIATIFIPLTFLAGVYGMNFRHMPELAWKWAYPTVWGIMISLGIFMFVLFKRKKWI